MEKIWNHVERSWPAARGDLSVGYRACREKADELLAGCSIATVAFSHFGVVVRSIGEALSVLSATDETAIVDVPAAWVEAYKVRVARFALGAKELEFIEPGGESFFAEHQRLHGDGLHHVSFQVVNVTSALQRLSAKGVSLVDQEPRVGSHGMVAFTAPGILSPVHLEVFQTTHSIR